MSNNNDTTFEALSKINVQDKVKTKGTGKQEYKYLSWVFAWSKIKTAFPDTNYKVLCAENGMPYFSDSFGIMIRTEVTIKGETTSMWLPVTDGANKALKAEPYSYKVKEYVGSYPSKWSGNYIDKYVEAASMFDINTATMRCLVKNFAMCGLGANIYANEDFIEKITINLSENSEIMKLIQDNNLQLVEFCNYYGVQKPMDLYSTNFNQAIELIENVIDSKKSIVEYLDAAVPKKD